MFRKSLHKILIGKTYEIQWLDFAYGTYEIGSTKFKNPTFGHKKAAVVAALARGSHKPKHT